MAVKTVKDVLDAHKGAGPGFDLLRILLATAIFLGHAKWLCGQGALPPGTPEHIALTMGGWEGWKRGIQESFVPAFFALSGFLVTGSALRTKVTSTFLAHRALRIFPALIVETLLSAVLLGMLFSTLSPAAYFSDPGLLRYLGNMVGWITFKLPGVFLSNPVPGVVNVNLWTLPSEFDCYFVSALLMAAGIIFRRGLLTWVFAIVTVAFALLNGFTDFAVTKSTMAPLAVTYYFFVGVIFFHWRDRLPVNWWLFALSGAIGYVLQSGHHAVFLAAPFVTYCTVMFGMLPVDKLKLPSLGDYSYGVYLYGFPITQAVMASLPGLKNHGWALFFIAGAITLGFAALSWRFIELPATRLKKHLPAKLFPSAPKPKVVAA